MLLCEMETNLDMLVHVFCCISKGELLKSREGILSKKARVLG